MTEKVDYRICWNCIHFRRLDAYKHINHFRCAKGKFIEKWNDSCEEYSFTEKLKKED